MDEKQLHRLFLPLASHASTTSTTSTADGFEVSTSDDNETTSSNFGISVRLLVILLIGVISIWANHEASKGFVITVINNMKNTQLGEKFTVFYISNDEAIRLVQSSSTFAVKVLFPGGSSITEDLIDQVEVQLASHNLTNDHTVAVKSSEQKNMYVLSISPLVMEFGDFKYRVKKEIQRGIAEILLLNHQCRAPKTLLDGMVEYTSNIAGFPSLKPVFKLRDFNEKCWEDKDPRVVAKFLAYGEEKSEGFVGKLNQEMKTDGWYEGLIDKVLGMSAIHFCAMYHDSMIKSEPLTI